MERETGSQIVGATAPVCWIDHKLSGVSLSRDFVESIQDSQIDGRALSGDIFRINHPVTEVTGHTIEVVNPREIGAVGWRAVSCEPGTWSVATKAEVTGFRRILIGDGQAGMEERISSGLCHDAGFPGIHGSMGEIGVTEVTGTAGDDGFTERSRLCTGLCPVLDRCWDRQILCTDFMRDESSP